MNIMMIILLGLSLSMDTFSLALSLGTLNISQKRFITYSFIVGLLHFILPLMGRGISLSLQKLFTINSHAILTIILVLVAIEMLINLFSKEEVKQIFNFPSMLLCALAVSIDSFSIGIGLFYSLSTVLLCSVIFFLLSSLFTYLGFIIGHFGKYKLGKMANFLGIILIFMLIFLQ